MYLRHVHIINKDDEALARRGTIRVLGPLLHVSLQVPLYIQGCGTTGEVHVEQQLQGHCTKMTYLCVVLYSSIVIYMFQLFLCSSWLICSGSLHFMNVFMF